MFHLWLPPRYRYSSLFFFGVKLQMWCPSFLSVSQTHTRTLSSLTTIPIRKLTLSSSPQCPNISGPTFHPGLHVAMSCLSLLSPSTWNSASVFHHLHDLDSCQEHTLEVLPQSPVWCSLMSRPRPSILGRNTTEMERHSSPFFIAGSREVYLPKWWYESWSPGHAGACQLSLP